MPISLNINEEEEKYIFCSINEIKQIFILKDFPKNILERINNEYITPKDKMIILNPNIKFKTERITESEEINEIEKINEREEINKPIKEEKDNKRCGRNKKDNKTKRKHNKYRSIKNSYS